VNEVCIVLAAAMGGVARVKYERNYPVMVNHDAQTFTRRCGPQRGGRLRRAPLVGRAAFV
jgi:hippurate hydrolase